MAEKLAIGAEFWTSWAVDWAANDTLERRNLYRVISHVNVARFRGDATGDVLPELLCIATESRPADMTVYGEAG